MGRRVAALDIGGTNIKACVFENGKVVQAKETSTLAHLGAERVLRRAGDLVAEFLPFEVVGVSTTGQVDPARGIVCYANNNMPGYTGINIKERFSSRFHVETVLLNDVYAAAVGEGTYGAAIGEQDFVCLTYGTGIGGGVILNGEPYYGKGASAGLMIGGMITHLEEMREGDDFSGSYERFASTTALVASAKRLDTSLTSGRKIFERIEEEEIRQLVDSWLDEVAAGVCALIHVYNVPCVILGGGIMEQPYAFEGAKKRIERNLIRGFQGVRIKPASLGNMAGLYGVFSLLERKYDIDKVTA